MSHISTLALLTTPLLLVTVFAILGRPSVALACVAITSGTSLAIRLYLTRRVLRRQIR